MTDTQPQAEMQKVRDMTDTSPTGPLGGRVGERAGAVSSGGYPSAPQTRATDVAAHHQNPSAPQTSTEHLLREFVSDCFADPLGFVLYAFPWDTGQFDLVKLAEPWASRYGRTYGPDKWACEFLDRVGAEVRQRGFDGSNAVAPLQMAVTSGHGIGKSTVTAWLILWIASTRPNSRGVVTANTINQLQTKTWAELAKWLKRCRTGHWFQITSSAGSMSLRHVRHKESWRCDALTARRDEAEGFAGLHAADSTPYFIFDEASAIPEIIWEVAEGGTTDGEPMWFAFGNPTRNSGRFRECWRKFCHRWLTTRIDSRQVAITNKERLQSWVDDYGEDSDFVRVRVRGEFPAQSLRQFISEVDVSDAWNRQLKPGQYQFAPVVLGVDPAWTGADEFVVWKRQGLMSQRLGVWEKNDNDIAMAGIIARLQDEHGAIMVNVDAGHGTGIVSAGRAMGRNWSLIWFSGKPADDGYRNKRAEMWGDMRNWLKDGGAIPADDVLRADLTGPDLVATLDGRIQLESKEDMRRRGVPSPNRADALALTFAQPVPVNLAGSTTSQQTEHEYDPLEHA